MSVFLRRSCGAALAYAVVTQGAFADVSASDVWADWQAYLGDMGYGISGEESVSGDVMTISNMTVSMPLPDTEGSFDMVMPQVTFTDNGDGTVSIGIPESFPLTVTSNVEGEDFSVDLIYSHDQLEMDVSGTPEEMIYDYTAKRLGISVGAIEVDGEAMPEDTVSAAFDIGNLVGDSKMLIGEDRTIDQKFTADTMTYALAFAEPGTDENAQINGQLDQLTFEGENVIPAGFNVADPSQMYEAGFSFSGVFTYGTGQTSMSGTSEGQDFSMDSSSQGGRFAASMDAERLAYDVEQDDAKLAVTTADLPFPIEIAMKNAGLKFEFPIKASEEVQPFGLAVNMTDFTMSDVLWSMFDPAGALPRDPASIALDATGTAKVLVNFLDPAVAESLETSDIIPGELHTLKVNELLVSLVGAKLTGDGDFAFDNSNTEEFDGLPAPSGVANLQLVGANALIDKLIAMGFVSENDAMGARMMMGMMAVPGDEPDTLKSTIEFTENGQILANGQRIK